MLYITSGSIKITPRNKNDSFIKMGALSEGIMLAAYFQYCANFFEN